MRLSPEMLLLGAAALLFGSPRRGSSAPHAGFLTLDGLRALAGEAGFSDVDTAAAVAMAESGGNASAVGDGGQSFGLWQIHVPSHPEVDRSRLLDARYNAAQALRISQHGSSWAPWTTYRNGAYRAFMPQGVS